MKSMIKGALSALIVVLALSGLTAASALAAGAPKVETKPANSIKGTSAFLNGVVNPNGVETKDYFEYGTTTSYGSKSREQTTTVEKKPSILVERLSTLTTYHFRMVATNSYGTSYGADEVFTTPAEKPEVVVPSGKITGLEFLAEGKGGGVAWGGGKSMSCNGSSFSGHFINSKELEGSERWSECFQTSGGGKTWCYNEYAEERGVITHAWIQSEPLRGTLGYINKAKKEIGLRLAGNSSETWANKVNCPVGIHPLTGSLGGLLNVRVNTKVNAFALAYTEIEDKQSTGELGGQLLWENGFTDFAFQGTMEGPANKEFEIQA